MKLDWSTEYLISLGECPEWQRSEDSWCTVWAKATVSVHATSLSLSWLKKGYLSRSLTKHANNYLNTKIYNRWIIYICLLCRKDNQIKQLEIELEQEKRMADNMVADMVIIILWFYSLTIGNPIE